MSIPLPRFDEALRWSVCVRELASGEVLAAHTPDVQCETASVGKVFLLLAVAERFTSGELDPAARLVVPDEHRVADSGLLYRMRDEAITLADAALLVGAFSDNLATNALIHLLGLDTVRAVAERLGLRDTSLWDYIRSGRTPADPWTPSFGTAAELSLVMRMLHRGEAISAPVSAQVCEWLAADADTSMLADAFLLDPLAHVDADYQGLSLRHKTGSTSFCRVDTGILVGPERGVAYAAAVTWKHLPGDHRSTAIDALRGIGEGIRQWVTGLPRDGS